MLNLLNKTNQIIHNISSFCTTDKLKISQILNVNYQVMIFFFKYIQIDDKYLDLL